MKILKFIPNTITSLNAFSGCLSVVFAFNNNLILAGIFIFAAAFFDFFDGLSARLLKAYSDMGKELDSLADMISFGFAPAAIAHILIKNQISPDSLIGDLSPNFFVLVIIPFIMTVFSGLRLAKFNVDSRQSDSFIGLATPANAMLWASVPFILKYQNNLFLHSAFSNYWIIIGLTILFSFLLIAELPMFSLKFKNLKFADNKIRFIFLIFSAALFIFLRWTAIPIIIFSYITVSVLQLITRKN